MSSKIEELIALVQKLPEDCLDEAIEKINKIIDEDESEKAAPPCPHCKSEQIVRFGRYKGKQRYRCNSCRRVFLNTTKTALSRSHYGESVWKQVIRDTLDGESMDNTAASLGLTHQTAFNMRHKILLSLESWEAKMPTVLDGVCEMDKTCVLESMKGRKKDGHGENSNFYNINTANSFHSFIKDRYNDYRGVATKYLNRYNVLFARAFKSGDDAVEEIYNILISTDLNLYNSIDTVKTANLLDL